MSAEQRLDRMREQSRLHSQRSRQRLKEKEEVLRAEVVPSVKPSNAAERSGWFGSPPPLTTSCRTLPRPRAKIERQKVFCVFVDEAADLMSIHKADHAACFTYANSAFAHEVTYLFISFVRSFVRSFFLYFFLSFFPFATAVLIVAAAACGRAVRSFGRGLAAALSARRARARASRRPSSPGASPEEILRRGARSKEGVEQWSCDPAEQRLPAARPVRFAPRWGCSPFWGRRGGSLLPRRRAGAVVVD